MKHMIAHDFGMISENDFGTLPGTELFSPSSDVKNDPFFTETSNEVQLALRSVHRVAERLGAGAPGLRGPFGWSPEALGKRVETVTVYVHPAK